MDVQQKGGCNTDDEAVKGLLEYSIQEGNVMDEDIQEMARRLEEKLIASVAFDICKMPHPLLILIPIDIG